MLSIKELAATIEIPILQHNLFVITSRLIPAMFVAQRVGHKKESTTTDMYGHAKKTLGPDLSNVFKKVVGANKAFDHDKLMEAYHIAANLLNNVIS